MLHRRRVLLNALASAAQVVVNGIVLFFLFRFLLDTIGVDDFGVWAVVLATTSMNHIANLGFSGSAVKFVAKYRALDDPDRVDKVVQTSIVSLALFLVPVLAAAYPILFWLLGLIIEPASKLPAAQSILPYALISFWLTSLTSVVHSCIDGLQRVDLRSLLVSGGALAYFASAVMLVPELGLIGLALAQVIQAVFVLAVSWLVLRRLMPLLPWLPVRWHGPVFKEMLSYSLNFQAITIAGLLFEPITKSLLSKFGGVGTAGYFEMANRLVVQLRSLIVTTHRSIVPAIADLQERNPATVRSLYAKSFRLVLFLIVSALPILVATTPIVSEVWIGKYEPTFVLYASLLFVAWFINIGSGPAYFAYMGTGRLRWNTLGHAVMGVMNGGFGVLLGWLYGATGVVAGFAIAIVSGSMVATVAYQYEHRIPLRDLLQPESLSLALAALFGAGAALMLYAQVSASLNSVVLGSLMGGLYLLIVALPFWRHSMRTALLTWIRQAFLSSRAESTSR